MTPAVLRRGDLTVAISTGGRSCRQARMIKQSLDRHLQSLETADLLIMGVSRVFKVGTRPSKLASI